jgi:DNA modification methylase
MIINGNNIEELKKFDDNYFDSIVTDPPYEIGFMGKGWDASGIANNPEMWSECLRVLKPGGYLLSFSATRTYHRMAVAIEDSGFEIRDMIEWVYGSGFPKSLNIGKAVDKLQGNERVFSHKNPANRPYNLAKGETSTGWQSPPRPDKTKGTSEFEGKGTALKPAHEPICMARKPLAEKTVAENVLKYGTGGINIDGSRVDFVSEEDKNSAKPQGNMEGVQIYKGQSQSESKTINLGFKQNSQGRFPANLIHDNSEEVRECFPNESERFFKSIIYQAKASKSERNKGCEDMTNNKPMYESHRPNYENTKGIETPYAGTGRTGNLNQNNHPTVKPVALMEYLIKMVTPTNGIVLDPFMGSGSTGVACVLNDFKFVGMDLDKDYCEIARARIEGVKETQTKMF